MNKRIRKKQLTMRVKKTLKYIKRHYPDIAKHIKPLNFESHVDFTIDDMEKYMCADDMSVYVIPVQHTLRSPNRNGRIYDYNAIVRALANYPFKYCTMEASCISNAEDLIKSMVIGHCEDTTM